jgi:hypothetical protein
LDFYWKLQLRLSVYYSKSMDELLFFENQLNQQARRVVAIVAVVTAALPTLAVTIKQSWQLQIDTNDPKQKPAKKATSEAKRVVVAATVALATPDETTTEHKPKEFL